MGISAANPDFRLNNFAQSSRLCSVKKKIKTKNSGDKEGEKIMIKCTIYTPGTRICSYLIKICETFFDPARGGGISSVGILGPVQHLAFVVRW